jgi:tetratricopeptide (TPR) repeat protein
VAKSLAALPAVLALLSTTAFAVDAPPAATTHAAPQATIHWQHKLKEVVVTRTDAGGKTIQQLDVSVLDYFLNTIGGYSDSNESQTDDARKQDVLNKLKRLTILLTDLDHGPSVDVNILQREARAYDLLYDLGFEDMAATTDALYQRLLKQQPDDGTANYLYGDFLARSDAKRPQSIPYLDKALKLGVKKANYTLGLVYITQGKDPQALACLKQYSADYPGDQRAKRLIAAVQSGSINTQIHP